MTIVAFALAFASLASVFAMVCLSRLPDPVVTVSTPDLWTSIHYLPTSSTRADGMPIVSRHRQRRATEEQKARLSKLMKLVEEAGLQDCVARVICDLSCNPKGFGESGTMVFNNLLKVQSSGAVNDSELKYYINAGLLGRKLRGTEQCSQCISYSKCKASSADLIDVASLIKFD